MSPQKKDHSKKTGEKPAAETDEKSTAESAKTAATAKDKRGGEKPAATKGSATGDKAAKHEAEPKSKKSGK